MAHQNAFDIYPEFKVIDTPVTMCRSKKTGLKVALVSAEGPMVSLYATVATEAITKPGIYHCDDGLPHTLEHLIFLGSKKYPYKGILDKLANRSLAEGTNAWTDVDHTAYTVSTAGQEAFLNLLPIYLDHILEPTITDEGFITEVHHVNENGENKGVVYCEMQGRENTNSDLAERACLGALFPDEKCGYKSETGGAMCNLRELSVDQVRRYHEEYYRPTNLFLIITGDMELSSLLKVLEVYDSEYANSHPKTGSSEYDQPWLTPVSPLPSPNTWEKHWNKTTDWNQQDDEDEDEDEEDDTNDDSQVIKKDAEEEKEPNDAEKIMLTHVGVNEKKIEFPSEDESCGTAVLAWRTEEFGDNMFQEKAKLDILMRYLFDSAASPLTKMFVESKDAFCADTFYAIETFRVGYLQIWFEGVAMENMEDVLPLFIYSLNNVLKDGINMERMNSVITKKRRRYKSSMEDSPADMLVTPLIKHFLYDGHTTDKDEVESLKLATDTISHLQECSKMTSEDWAQFLEDKLLKRACVCVQASPSANLVQELERANNEREILTRKTLGAKGLAAKAEVLEAAQKMNNRIIPEDILKSVPIPSVKNIAMFDINTFRTKVGGNGKFEIVRIHPNMSTHRLTKVEQEAREFDKNTKFETHVSFNEDQVAGHENVVSKVDEEAREFDKNVKFETHVSFNENQVAGHENVVSKVDEEAREFDKNVKFAQESHVSFNEKDIAGHEDKVNHLCFQLNECISSVEWPSIPLQMDQVSSEFLRLSVALDTHDLTNKERLYLVLLQEIWFKMPTLNEDGSVLGYEETVNALENDLVSYNCSVGYSGGTFRVGEFGSLFFTNVRVEKGDLGTAAKWMKKILFGLKMDASRLLVACSSLLASIPEEKRSGRSMAGATLTEIIFKQNSNNAASTPLRQKKFLNHLVSILKSKNESDIELVLNEINLIRNKLISSLFSGAGRMRIAGDFHDSTNQFLPILLSIFPKDFLNKENKSFNNNNNSLNNKIKLSCDLLTHNFLNTRNSNFNQSMEEDTTTKKGLIVGLSSIENSNVYLASRGIPWLDDYEASLMVAIEYLTALEGDFWLALRGSGLTYGSDIYLDKEDKLIYFALSRCASPSLAYLKAKEIVDSYSNGKTVIKTIEFENAKSSLTSSLLSRWESKSGALGDVYKSWFYLEQHTSEIPSYLLPVATALTYRKTLMTQIENVTINDILKVLKKFLCPMFQMDNACFAIATPNPQCDDVANSFGMKNMMQCLVSPFDPSRNDVIAIKEKSLDELFPIDHITIKTPNSNNTLTTINTTDQKEQSSEKTNQIVTQKDEEGELEKKHVWPFVAQPYWRQSPAVVSSGVVAVVAIATLVVMKGFRLRR